MAFKSVQTGQLGLVLKSDDALICNKAQIVICHSGSDVLGKNLCACFCTWEAFVKWSPKPKFHSSIP